VLLLALLLLMALLHLLSLLLVALLQLLLALLVPALLLGALVFPLLLLRQSLMLPVLLLGQPLLFLLVLAVGSRVALRRRSLVRRQFAGVNRGAILAGPCVFGARGRPVRRRMPRPPCRPCLHHAAAAEFGGALGCRHRRPALVGARPHLGIGARYLPPLHPLRRRRWQSGDSDDRMERTRKAGLIPQAATVYFAASAFTMDAKIFQPSDEPRIFSLERSGCGIMPSTLRPSFRMPAMFPSEPLGLAPGVIAPSGVA